ncbi:MAG: ThuA domain-containing protein [Planctomycetota bacterium]|jgi:type 1 glutamine amidotransferase
MSDNNLTRRTFLRSTSLIAAGAVSSALTLAGCGSTLKGTPPRLRAVLWVGGFAHDFDAFADIMTGFLPKQIPIDIEVVRDGTFLDSPDASKLDVIIMNHCFKTAEGVLTETQKTKLLELIRSGTGVVAVHASYYSFTEWDQCREIYGAKFIDHDEVDIMLEVSVTDQDHPITKGLPESFETHSELYQSTLLSADCHLLAMAKEKGTDTEYPSVWTRKYGQGRVVTILPAHWPDAYHSKPFQKLIAQSIKWASLA